MRPGCDTDSGIAYRRQSLDPPALCSQLCEDHKQNGEGHCRQTTSPSKTSQNSVTDDVPVLFSYVEKTTL